MRCRSFLSLVGLIFAIAPSHAATNMKASSHASPTGNNIHVIQFAPDPTKFPKCVGDNILASEFVVLTNGTAADNAAAQSQIRGMSTAVAGSITASLTWNNHLSTCTYQVMGGGLVETPITPKVINMGPANITTEDLWEDGSATQNQYINVISHGAGTFQLTDWTPWSACGGGVTYSTSKGLNKGGTFAVTFDVAKIIKVQGQGQLIWTSQTTAGTSYGPFSSHKVRLRIYAQPASVTSSGILQQYRNGMVDPFSWNHYTWFSWIICNSHYSDFSIGNFDPAVTGLQECCGASN